jgi:uncharacterized protein HemX
MLENLAVPGVSIASVSAAGVSAAAGHNGAHMMLMVIPVVIVIAAVAGVVYFVRQRRDRSADMNAEDRSDSWTRPPSDR